MIRTLGTALGWMMRLCFRLTGHYGLSIILFTLLTKVLLFPVNLWTQKNSIRMVQLMPEENALKIKYIDDKDKLADERLALYKRYHYRPLAGMIPLLIQIPLVLGLVYVIYHPLSFVLRFPAETLASLREWLTALPGIGEITENSYQPSIISQIKAGILPAGAQFSDAVSQISGLNTRFLGIDLSAMPSLSNPVVLLVPLFSGLSAWLMCWVQNRINILQVTQGKVNKFLTTAFMIAFSTYFAFLVPAGVGVYWIFGNLFAIPVMYLLNLVMPPQKHVDLKMLREMDAQRQEKERIHKQYRAKEKEDYRRFSAAEHKRLVFYSEQNGFYKYFAGIIGYICEHSDVTVHYVTSDPNDQIFSDPREQIKAYYVASDTSLIALFMKLDCDICVMTVPDLEKYHIKRSRVRDNVEYIFTSHGMGSTALTFRKGALDWFDTVFCPGPDTFSEIRDAEALYGTPKKRLVETGYPLIDEMIEKYEASEHPENAVPRILIAPSWQPDNIIDLCIGPLLDALAKTDYEIILRPHPQQVRHEPEKFELLKKQYADNPRLQIQTDFSSNNPVMESDILITDWSDISWEFAFVTKRPVLFIDTPMKIMNPEYDKIQTKPINITLRNVIGRSVQPEAVSEVPEIIAEMLRKRADYREIIEKTRSERIYNLGQSAKLCGRYILKSLDGKI